MGQPNAGASGQCPADDRRGARAHYRPPPLRLHLRHRPLSLEFHEAIAHAALGTFEQDTLSIQGSYGPQQTEERQWILRERPRGTFRRRFTLQVPVDVENVDATYRNGLLILTLPKSPQSKPRKIEVKAAS